MRIRTGITGLDEMLDCGFVEERNILVSGPCGSGKTTLAMQFVYNGAVKCGEPGLFMSLEEKTGNVCPRLENFGWT